MQNQSPEYVDTKGAAAIVGMSASFLSKARFRRSDGPPFIKVSRKRVLYKVEDLHAWMAAQRRSNTSERG